MTGEFVLRIFIATVLGAIIGIDREYRTKSAGFRTNVLVALGSALFMIISVHGFDYEFFANESLAHEDNMREHLNALRLDPARIAAQVVTGIGFIGAGTIILQKNVVRGLTTAAGLWVTAAIGMACGVGMYVVAAVSTTLVMICYEAFNFFLLAFYECKIIFYIAEFLPNGFFNDNFIGKTCFFHVLHTGHKRIYNV